MPEVLYGESYFTPTILESNDEGDALKIRGVFQRSDVKNKNGRIYPRGIWEKTLSEGSSAAQKLKDRSMIGHLEHPRDGVTDMNEMAILVTDLKLEKDGTVIGEAEVCDTPKGRIVQECLKRNITIGVSSRGKGSVKSSGEVGDDFMLETFDVVYNPSTPGANPSQVSENADVEESSTSTKSVVESKNLSERVYDKELRVRALLQDMSEASTERERRAIRDDLLKERQEVSALAEEEKGLFAPVVESIVDSIKESMEIEDTAIEEADVKKMKEYLVKCMMDMQGASQKKAQADVRQMSNAKIKRTYDSMVALKGHAGMNEGEDLDEAKAVKWVGDFTFDVDDESEPESETSFKKLMKRMGVKIKDNGYQGGADSEYELSASSADKIFKALVKFGYYKPNERADFDDYLEESEKVEDELIDDDELEEMLDELCLELPELSEDSEEEVEGGEEVDSRAVVGDFDESELYDYHTYTWESHYEDEDSEEDLEVEEMTTASLERKAKMMYADLVKAGVDKRKAMMLAKKFMKQAMDYMKEEITVEEVKPSEPETETIDTDEVREALSIAKETINSLKDELSTAREQIVELSSDEEVDEALEDAVESLIDRAPELEVFEDELLACRTPSHATRLAAKLIKTEACAPKHKSKSKKKDAPELDESVQVRKPSNSPYSHSELFESSIPKNLVSEDDVYEPKGKKTQLNERTNRTVSLALKAVQNCSNT